MESTSEMNLQIYKFIADLVQDPEFSSTTAEFLNNVYTEFSEEDENKLEYTQIHTDYVKILDEIIQSKVGEKYEKE
jgi:CRISPR/Cas system endoribonuclease Cas6 (RAMP superfamily)